jgi:hypothetical protein
MEPICQLVCKIIKKYLPDIHDKLRVFCEILPFSHHPITYPFPGFVLNCQVCTEGHTDTKDNLICVVIPFGDCEGGELVLYEAGLVFELKEGAIIIFPSFDITHFNLHFKGTRWSFVMHSDKEVESWNKDRNGWNNHIVV